MEERLQKIISSSIGMKADLEKDHIKVKGKLINSVKSKVYMIFNKPLYCLTAMSDAGGRPTVNDFLKRVKARVFPVGRLDYNSEGLLILTNDGELTNSIMHPKNKIPKTYRVKVDGFLEKQDISKLEKGMRLEDGRTAPAKVKIIKSLKANSWVDLTIYEGRKRQVRRMFDKIRHPVIKLIRTRINGLSLGNLEPGAFRYLTPEEVEKLKREVVNQ